MILMFSMIGVTSACSNSTKQEKLQLTEEINQIKEENQNLANEINDLKQKNEDLSEQIRILQDEINQLKQGNDVSNGEKGEATLTIYSGNIDTYEREEVGKLVISNAFPLDEKLAILAERLSQDVFEGLGIELSEIDTIHGKQVAIINLTEKENPQGATWKELYFQGSAGGAITSVALGDTFLQREYDGEWIDGVRFLYNNQEIEFQHVEGLSEVNYRE